MSEIGFHNKLEARLAQNEKTLGYFRLIQEETTAKIERIEEENKRIKVARSIGRILNAMSKSARSLPLGKELRADISDLKDESITDICSVLLAFSGPMKVEELANILLHLKKLKGSFRSAYTVIMSALVKDLRFKKCGKGRFQLRSDGLSVILHAPIYESRKNKEKMQTPKQLQEKLSSSQKMITEAIKSYQQVLELAPIMAEPTEEPMLTKLGPPNETEARNQYKKVLEIESESQCVNENPSLKSLNKWHAENESHEKANKGGDEV